MLSAVIALAFFGCIALAWSSSRAAAETACWHGQRACTQAGVQWLDQTVMLEAISFKRASDGWMRVARRYRFDYSIDGVDRKPGRMALLGRELQWISLPQPVPSTSTLLE